MLAANLRPLIFCPSIQVIRQHLPKALKDYQHFRCTMGCTDVFIESPRDLELQAITWNDYKIITHNFLLASHHMYPLLYL